MSPNLKQPSKGLALFTYGAGVLTAIALISGLEFLSSAMSNQNAKFSASNPTDSGTVAPKPLAAPEAKFAKEDAASLDLVGERLSPQQIAMVSPYRPKVSGSLTPAETEVARTAWQYFEQNLNPDTGLVNSADKFASVTMWDQSAAMAAVVSAKELNLISQADFKANMSRMLATLAQLPLYKGELPNKVYNSKTLIPVGYGQLEKREEIGWSALDIARLALWLKIVAAKYPEFKPQTEALWKTWRTDRLVKGGQMYGTSKANQKENYNQEGRLGYENYAAYGLKLWNLKVSKALDVTNKAAFIKLYGKNVPFDIRDRANSKANNYVLSEPYFLDGIETGFQALPKAYADQVLAAQEARYNATQQLTAITEDNLDRAPYFVYSTLFVNGSPWATITDNGQIHNNLRFLSTKAAIGWHVLYDTPYTAKLFNFIHKNLQAKGGLYSGFYETLATPNAVLTANNNGIILESLLYKKVGQPLLSWSGASNK